MQLKAQLQSLATKCSSLSDIAIKYYATELPPKVDASLKGMVERYGMRSSRRSSFKGNGNFQHTNQLSTANSGKNGETSYEGFQFGCIYYFAQAVETSVSCIDN